MFVAERYQRFLDHNDAYGVIVLDSRMKEADDRLRRFFTRMQRKLEWGDLSDREFVSRAD